MIVLTLLQALIVDVLIQGIFGIVAMIARTEKFYDAVGCASFALLAWLSLPRDADSRSKLLSYTVIAARLYLGMYLLQRVIRRGGDRRFTKAKQSRATMAVFWMGQATWVWTTMLPVLIVNGGSTWVPLKGTPMDWLAGAIMVGGLAMEVVADLQKHRFQQNPLNAEKFIDTGLWKLCRHPNYFGELMFWLGIYLLAVPAMPGMWKYVGALSPLFETFLLTSVSGVPLLEKHGKIMWGNDPKYQEYVHNTPMLVPFVKLM